MDTTNANGHSDKATQATLPTAGRAPLSVNSITMRYLVTVCLTVGCIITAVGVSQLAFAHAFSNSPDALTQAALLRQFKVVLLGGALAVILLQCLLIVRPVRQRMRHYQVDYIELDTMRQREARYQAVVEQMTEGILIVDVETLQVLEANPALQTLLGYTMEELQQLTLYDLKLHNKASIAHNSRKVLQQGEYLVGKRLLRHKDGSAVEVELKSQRITYSGRVAISALVRSMEDKTHTEKILQEREQWFQLLIENATDIITILDADATICYNSTSVERVLGYKPEELIGQSVLAYLHPADTQFLNHVLDAQTSEEGVLPPTTYRFRHKDGSWRTLEAIGNNLLQNPAIKGLVINAWDITEHEQTEAALRESEERYRSVIAAMQEGIVLQDKDGVIQACNPSAERLLGLTVDQMVGRTSLDPRWRAIHEDGSPFLGETHPAVVTLRTGKACSHVVMGVHKPDDSLTWISINSEPIFHASRSTPDAVVITFTDISDHKRYRETLRRRDTILEAVSFAATCFLEANGWESNIAAVLERLGRAAEVSRVYIFENHWDDNDKLLMSQRYEWVMDDIEPQIDNFELQHLDYHSIGLQRWVEVLCSGEPVYGRVDALSEAEQALLVPQDILAIVVVPIFVGRIWWGFMGFDDCITQRDWSSIETDALKAAAGALGTAMLRAQSEEALRSSETTNRALLNAIPDIMFQVDRDGFYLDCSFPRESPIQINPSLLIGKHITEVLPPAIAEQILAANQKALQTQTMQVLEYQHSLDGKPQDLESRIVVSSEDTVLVIVRDITERKKVERMKNEFVSTVSHELRTPLTSIRGALGLVVGGVAGALPAQMQGMVEIAYNNSERLVRLINDILDIEKIESGKLVFDVKPVELMPLVEQAIDANCPYGQQFGVVFVLKEALPGVQVYADGDRLMQVLANLLSNAAKFSPRDDIVTMAVMRHNGAVRVSVSDNGPGIPEEFQSRIFQKFAQADSSDTREVAGTGLGLSISKAIVEKLGGVIGFETGLGTGTTFYFDLPEYNTGPEMEKPNVPNTDRPHILICETRRHVVLSLQSALSNSGFTADIAVTTTEMQTLLSDNLYVAIVVNCIPSGENVAAFVQALQLQKHGTSRPCFIASKQADQLLDALDDDTLDLISWIDNPLDHPRLVMMIQYAMLQHAPRRPRILHVEDDADVTQFISVMLQDVADVISVRSLRDARQRLAAESFDLILLDIGLTDGSGLELLSRLRAQTGPPIPVVVFSAHEVDTKDVQQIAATLIKSRTSNEKLLHTIMSLITLSVSTDLVELPTSQIHQGELS